MRVSIKTCDLKGEVNKIDVFGSESAVNNAVNNIKVNADKYKAVAITEYDNKGEVVLPVQYIGDPACLTL